MVILHKKGDLTKYRLISLRSVVSKMSEAILASRLSAYLADSESLSPFLCGFRGKRRCQHHIALAGAVKSNALQGKRRMRPFST